jgi:hypothetical protein
MGESELGPFQKKKKIITKDTQKKGGCRESWRWIPPG